MYAVVKFVIEDTVSEVPDTWLEGTDQCWWPSKNAQHLIQKGIAPGTGNSHWQKHDVVIEATCLSYEVARKKAMQYSSSDESSKGQGRRNVVSTVNDDYLYDSDSESSSVLSSIPKLTVPILTKAKVMSKCQRKNESCSQRECITGLKTNRRASSQPLFDITNAEVITVEQLYEEQEENERQRLKKNFLEENVHPGSNTSKDNNTFEVVELEMTNNKNSDLGNNRFSKDDEVLRLLIKISLQLDSIDQRISNIEKRNNQSEDTDNRFQFIKDLLPMTFDTIANVDNILSSNKEIIKEMKDFLHTVGGNSPRDHIHRMLSLLFTNECATKCSWKGHRNNRQVFDLKVIMVMKEVIVGNYAYVTQHEIEQIAAEWFRFAKQRYEREKKKACIRDMANMG